MKIDKKEMLLLAEQVLNIESQAIDAVGEYLLGDDFIKAVELILNCKGRVVVTGMGKTGIIGQKFSATLASTGTPSLWLHSAEAVHGDLGRVTPEDIIVAISNSGETEELIKFLPLVKKIGSPLIAITGRRDSKLAKHSNIVLEVRIEQEACPLGLAPTTSTTVILAVCDVLSVVVQKMKGFREEDFAFYHPAGSLGKKLLLKVSDIMRKGSANPIVKEDTAVKEVLLSVTRARAGAASVIDDKGRLTGIFTDGDLRRHIEKGEDLIKKPIKEVMTVGPVTVSSEMLAQEALRIMETKKIDEIPVVDNDQKPVGMLDVQDLLEAGLV